MNFFYFGVYCTCKMVLVSAKELICIDVNVCILFQCRKGLCVLFICV